MKPSRTLLGYVLIPALALAVLSGCSTTAKAPSPASDAGASDPIAPHAKGGQPGPTGNPVPGKPQKDAGSQEEDEDAGIDAAKTKPDAGKSDAGPKSDAGDAGDGGAPVDDDPDGIDTQFLETATQI